MKRVHGLQWLGALVLTGASSIAAAQAPDWSDVEGRIQYAYYTNDARALESVLVSLKPKPVDGEEAGAGDAGFRHYFRALAHYRRAQVLAETNKSQAKDSIGDCGDEVDSALKSLPKVPIGLDELPRALEPEIRDQLVAALKAIGYAHVTIDLQGYRMGSLNEGVRLRPA